MGYAEQEALISLSPEKYNKIKNALENIRLENEKFAETAMMDWDRVQELAQEALDILTK